MMPRYITSTTLFAGLAVLLSAGSGSAQIPEEFDNLQVLDHEISRGELVSLMRGFASALGLRCNSCHVGDDPDDLEGYDFASDEKELKVVARGMLEMVGEINETFIPLAGRAEHMQVQCATCHRGLRVPLALRALMLQTIDEEGTEAAVTRYGELRDQYYGRAAYDFGQGSLNNVAETLARRGDVEDALTIIRLNIEHNPDIGYPNVLHAQILFMMEDREGAIAAIERAIELEPDNDFYKQQLERLRSPGQSS